MGGCKKWLGLECVILAQAQLSLLLQCQGGASTSQLKRGTGLLAMARRPWRVLQAICQPAQPTAPASRWQSPRSANYPADDAPSQDPAWPMDGTREEPVDTAQMGKQSSLCCRGVREVYGAISSCTETLQDPEDGCLRALS